MIVTIEGGRIRRIEPHPDNRATPEGVCLKGLSYVERVTSPDRLLHPLRRRRRGGTFERISWDDALETIATRLERVRGSHGSQAVLYYGGSGTKGLLNGIGAAFWRLYGGYTTTYGDLCWPAGLEATRLTLGENTHSAPWDLANARLIVLWGKNSAETNIHQMPFVEQALARGSRLVVIDPRRTQTAERADLFIQPRPGTDGAIALAVAQRLIAQGLIDQVFIDQHALGFDEFAAAVRDFSPERAAGIAEVPVEQIERLTDLIGRRGPVTICPGFGMQRYTNSGQTMRSLLALLVITGNVGRPGAGWAYANLQSHVFDSVKDPIAFFPPTEPDGVARVSISTARLGRDMLAQRDPPLAMAWVERGNPITQNPETNAVLAAFRSLEFVVVVDQFLTDTAREADIVLPAKTLFEQSDVIGAYWHPYIQLKQKLLDPPGEVKPESEVYWLLAHRLGIDPLAIRQVLPEPGDDAIEAYLEHRLSAFTGLTLARLREGPVLAPGYKEVAFADLVFPTPSGRIELWSEDARRRWGVDPLPSYVEPEESVRQPASGRAWYPLYLMTPNTKNRIHSQFNNLAMIRQVSPAPTAQLHPDDARARGIPDGGRIRIFNDRGAFEVTARLDAGIRPGCVAVANGWWITDGATVNLCTLGRETDIGHGAAFHDTRVAVERVE
jgi:anaerobic selenocysteine-containing dehydrogenase